MTPKQKYDERKRQRLEAKAKAEERPVKDEWAEDMLASMENSLRRIADVAELWADLQKDQSNDH